MLRKIRGFFVSKPTVPPPPEDPLALKFANFFTEYAQNPPPAQGYEMVGWAENYRISELQRKSNYFKRPDLGTFSCEVYEICTRNFRAIVSYYESSDEILWLDNHQHNHDFENFVLREKLLSLLPNEITKFVSMFTAIKLNYLGFPKLVSNASQIALSKERYEKLWRISKEFQQKLLDDEKRLDKLSEQIFPPICNLAKEGFSLTFFVWTKTIGRVIQVNCEISQLGVIHYTLTELASGLGDYFVPR